jgi:hypothetical protein
MIVAIHQPNYAPWLGYFHKIAQSDVFVFLDDAQYSRGSYTNRVRIGRAGNAVWLTQPVKREFGDAISDTRFSDDDWPTKHLDTLKGAYRSAPAFNEVWPVVQAIWQQVPRESLAVANRYIVEALVASIDLRPKFFNASTLLTDGATGDERLARIMRAVAPEGGVYLSGKGGSDYQSPETFSNAGYKLRYAEFQHPEYARGDEPFLAGLSVLDALFNVGVDATRRLIDA